MIINNTKFSSLESNAKWVIFTDKEKHVTTAYLKATQDIHPDQEVLVPYSTLYRFEDS
jgi:hypothetical protein